MNSIKFFEYPGQYPACTPHQIPVDGRFSVVDESPNSVAIRFESTNNVAVIPLGGLIHDRVKRLRSGDPEHWYCVAVARAGEVLRDGRKIVDVRTKTRMFLDDNSMVHTDFKGGPSGLRPKSRPAYLKWRALMRSDADICLDWCDYENFEAWYLKHRPDDGQRWSLRSRSEIYAPHCCGFDRRVDQPTEGAAIVDGIFTRDF